ncbi:MAG TPA: alpha/beta hydrolase [Gammaproteobacteria bacterium]|nr:alpha/beta hydrolase [Gammaproteobacteria bacterium]
MNRTNVSTFQTLELHDGRTLAWAEYGVPDGRALLYFHGLPGSHRECELLAPAARTLDLRVIAVDRPGYSRSSWQPRRRLLDWPRDVSELCDALGLDQVMVLGVSGGAPCALACAHAIPERIAATATVCGLGPVALEALLRDMRWRERLAFRMARRSPALLGILVGQPLSRLARSAPALAIRALALANGDADRRVLAQEGVRRILAATLREALRQGPRGALHEVSLYARPWGFDPATIRLPVQMWHGDADRVVPLSHSRYLAGRLPHASLHVQPGEGHFSLPIRHAATILAALAAS